MSGATALAALAGLLAAGALIELAVAHGEQVRDAADPAGSGPDDGAAAGADDPRRAAVRLRRRLLGLLARLGRRVAPAAAPGELAARLVAAGEPFGLDAADAMAVKGGAALAGLATAVPLASALPGRLGPALALVLPAAAFLTPDLWLARRVRRRGEQLERELPDLLDLLRVAIDAGLPLERALGEVGRRTGGLLAREWRIFAAHVELGIPRARALELLGRRCPGPRVAALLRSLDRAARHGAPLGETLAAQAREARAADARRLNERAARAAPKIQLVVALLLVPSVLLLVGAALLTAFMG